MLGIVAEFAERLVTSGGGRHRRRRRRVRVGEPFDITSFSLVPAEPAPEASRDYLAERGLQAQMLASNGARSARRG